MVNLDGMKRAVILRKPSGTISIGGSLDAREHKFYNVFLKVVEEEVKKDIRKFIFEVPLEILKSALNVKERDKNNVAIKKIIKNMHKIDVEYNILGKDKTVDGYASLLDNVEYETDKGGNTIVRFSVPEIVRKSFINRNNKNEIYASIDLIIVRGLTGKYAIRLYELVKDYERVEIPLMPIDKFRKLFGIENKYSKMPDLRKRVLDTACEELNSNPNVDFLIEYKLIKTGKAYTHIKFIVKPKPVQIQADQKLDKMAVEYAETSSDLKELLKMLPKELRKRKIIGILMGALKERKPEYVKAQLKYTLERYRAGDIKKSFDGYLKKALEEDYAGVEDDSVILDDEELTYDDLVGMELEDANGRRYEITGIEEKDSGLPPELRDENEYIVHFRYLDTGEKDFTVLDKEILDYMLEDLKRERVERRKQNPPES